MNNATIPKNTTSNPAISKIFNNHQSDTIALLRIVSAVGIFAIHTHGKLGIEAVSKIAKYGQDGLWVFYILSGLLVMKSYAESPSLKIYWKKRISRIVPSYYFLLALIIIFKFEWITADPFAIPRAIFMLEYIAPPIVSYSYSAMYMLGVIAIFMMFYLAVPFIAKIVKSLEAAFVALLMAAPFCIVINKVFYMLYGNFCPPNDLDTMSGYLLASVAYFAVGIMTYFGLKENRKLELMIYCLIFLVMTFSYDFWKGNTRTAYMAIIVVGLLCAPLKLEKLSNILKFLNKYIMGFF